MIRSEGLPLEKRDQAVAEMEQLAESGDMNAQYLMGKLLRDGPLLIPDSVKARRWLEWAVAQGHTATQYALGKLLISGMLCHYSTEFTLDVYTNVTKEMQKDAAKKIGGFMAEVM